MKGRCMGFFMYNKKSMIRVFISSALIPAVLGLFCFTVVSAVAEDTGFPFTAEPVYPENQVESDAGYWYVDALKGRTQEFTANVKNIGTEDITVAVESADCYTYQP